MDGRATDDRRRDGRLLLAEAVDDGVQLMLRQRDRPTGGPVLELIVDGVFAMDDVDVSTEVALAQHALAGLDPAAAPWTVVVAGLGLGFTAAAVLADPRVGRLVVVELHAPLADWARQGLLPQAGVVLRDARTELVVGDVTTVVPARRPPVAAILLDVDNGPDFLVHTDNAAVYADPFLAAAATVLQPGGVLAVWSADRSPDLQRRLARRVGPCREVRLEVRREGRTFSYAVYLATRE